MSFSLEVSADIRNMKDQVNSWERILKYSDIDIRRFGFPSMVLIQLSLCKRIFLLHKSKPCVSSDPFVYYTDKN